MHPDRGARLITRETSGKFKNVTPQARARGWVGVGKNGYLYLLMTYGGPG